MSTERLDARAAFERGEIEKHEFAKRMAQLHDVLREYGELVRGTDVEGIEITDGQVVLRSRYGGARFPCDPRDRGIPPIVALNFGGYERKDFEMVRRLFPPGGTFVDVGANIGWYSVHVALGDPAARVIAIEPVAASRAWLVRAVALNGLANVQVVARAISDRVGEVVLFVSEGIAGAASAAPAEILQGAEPVSVGATTLDDLARVHDVRADFLKLDIEGGEFAALRGARRMLERDRPMVFAEMLRKLSKPFGYHPNEIISYLAELEYRCFRVENASLVPFTTMDEATVETNFFFLHRGAHEGVIARLAVAR
ncbi:hypothetical protein rosag_32160 [Roseisolibacter agri]|uniref:Methyltransferase FkbM domain-containing protein n=2 Tax=Roseisolibacter agri TaxID=2014610 RepID=A0AA37QH38_9BACT|nr:hypothetical protein rosag_32160 [Roseisolibacter agri]